MQHDGLTKIVSSGLFANLAEESQGDSKPWPSNIRLGTGRWNEHKPSYCLNVTFLQSLDHILIMLWVHPFKTVCNNNLHLQSDWASCHQAGASSTVKIDWSTFQEQSPISSGCHGYVTVICSVEESGRTNAFGGGKLGKWTCPWSTSLEARSLPDGRAKCGLQKLIEEVVWSVEEPSTQQIDMHHFAAIIS